MKGGPLNGERKVRAHAVSSVIDSVTQRNSPPTLAVSLTVVGASSVGQWMELLTVLPEMEQVSHHVMCGSPVVWDFFNVSL